MEQWLEISRVGERAKMAKNLVALGDKIKRPWELKKLIAEKV
jgi:hypothetical protein